MECEHLIKREYIINSVISHTQLVPSKITTMIEQSLVNYQEGVQNSIFPHQRSPVNWKPQTVFINERGLYQKILRSKKPEALHFQRGGTSKVLLSIRNTGAYVSPNIDINQILKLLGIVEDTLVINQKKDKMLQDHLFFFVLR